MTEMPPDLIKARKLLEELLRIKDHRKRSIDLFEDATELLEAYVHDDSDQGQYARLLQKTYVRRFLEQLPSPHDLDIGEWLYYFSLLSLMEAGAESLRVENAELYIKYDSFMRSRASEALDVLSPYVK